MIDCPGKNAGNGRFLSSQAGSGTAVSSSLVAFELSECSVAASGTAVLIDPRIADDVALRDESGHFWGA